VRVSSPPARCGLGTAARERGHLGVRPERAVHLHTGLVRQTPTRKPEPPSIMRGHEVPEYHTGSTRQGQRGARVPDRTRAVPYRCCVCGMPRRSMQRTGRQWYSAYTVWHEGFPCDRQTVSGVSSQPGFSALTYCTAINRSKTHSPCVQTESALMQLLGKLNGDTWMNWGNVPPPNPNPNRPRPRPHTQRSDNSNAAQQDARPRRCHALLAPCGTQQPILGARPVPCAGMHRKLHAAAHEMRAASHNQHARARSRA
jgi:hypothetical protein